MEGVFLTPQRQTQAPTPHPRAHRGIVEPGLAQPKDSDSRELGSHVEAITREAWCRPGA